MGLPSKKRTPRSKKERASHFALKEKTVTSKCSECSAPILPHHACRKCGNYRGRKAVNTQKRVERTLKNKKKQ